MKLMESTDYSQFEIMSFNRSVRNTDKLEKSMSRHGWIHAFPAYVVKSGKKLMIKDGHHRFFCAKKLGLPVVYVACADDISITDIQTTTTPWSLSDYLDSFVRLGYPHYVTVKEFRDKTGINLAACISMLAGSSATSTNYSMVFKAGAYEPGDTNHAESVALVVGVITKTGIEWASNTNLVAAISTLALYDGTDLKRLVAKIKNNKALLEKRSTIYQYLELLEEIYNRASKDKTPIAFLASEASKKRQKTFGGSNKETV